MGKDSGNIKTQLLQGNQATLLELLSIALYNNTQAIDYNALDKEELLIESMHQAVIPLVVSVLSPNDNLPLKWTKINQSILANNICCFYEHGELHELLTNNRIPYTILKGIASACYYPNPILRTMGDVDFLINPINIEQTDKILRSIDFENEGSGDAIEIVYRRQPKSVWELHLKVNGIPDGDMGDVARTYLSNIIESSKFCDILDVNVRIPNALHHGIVLLLHMVHHLTTSGVGLRHFCDWSVFVSSFSNDEFVSIFYKPLHDLGLWKYAQLLTLCSMRYLHSPEQQWAGIADEMLLEAMMVDIFDSGNFGSKEKRRADQNKYLVDRANGTISKNPVYIQFVQTLNYITLRDYGFARKCRLLMPIGWLLEVFRVFKELVVRKRKINTIKIIYDAGYRKTLYKEYLLFEKK